MDKNNKATISMVLGIISVVLAWFGYGAIAGVATGIVAIVLAIQCKKEGFESGQRTAGFVLGIIGTILSGVLFVACVACVACAAGLSSMSSY